MTGQELTDMALRLHDEIVQRFRPTPESFEDLAFHADPGRVVVWSAETPEYRDMAVAHLSPPQT